MPTVDTAPLPSLTCPAWCATDHNQALERFAATVDALVRRGELSTHDGERWIEDDAQASRQIHSATLGEAESAVTVETSAGNGELYVLSTSGRVLDASACREYAANLLRAASLLETRAER